MSFVSERELFQHLQSGKPVLDVRAEVEFESGSIPSSTCVPILNNDERHRIGWTYKNKGPEEAVKLGYEIVSGENKEAKVRKWTEFFHQNPTAILTCFRGGQRSGIAQAWLKEVGIDRPRIQGGYKKVRQFLLETLEQKSQSLGMLIVSGPTGSGKTRLIEALPEQVPTVNLENIAKHRGSAFGHWKDPQPGQADYENRLAQRLLNLQDRGPEPSLVIEDESRMIGHIVQPESFFKTLRNSALVVIEEDLEFRVQQVYEDYISSIQKLSEEDQNFYYENYQKALGVLQKKLGDERSRKAHRLLMEGRAKDSKELHLEWIRILIGEYYDPLYLKSFQKRNPRIQFRGSFKDCWQYLSEQYSY
ncbi:MAG: tRNA 2-selenouridine(34) synthase MnmH [Pseudobdellovibrionaceae bacterium]